MPASDQKRRLTAFVVAMALLIATPLAVVASHPPFTDVPDSSVHHDNIDWLRNAGVTSGCNPPANDRYCPTDNVTRAQMATFMRNLAENKVVHAATAETATPVGTAGGALDGEYPNPNIAAGAVGSEELADAEPFRIVGEAGEPLFQNGWGNFSAAFSDAGFYKDLHNVVHLKGTMSGGTNGAIAFTLPEGYRPAENLFLPMAGGGPQAANLIINTNGTVVPTCDTAPCIPGIDGLSFRVGVAVSGTSPAGESPND